jgi:hypothetical protein
MIQQWNYCAAHPFTPTLAQIIAAYSGATGYVPGDPSTDQGTDMASYLQYWQTEGVAGHKIAGFLEVDWTNIDEVRMAVSIFGNLFYGVSLPTAVQGLTSWMPTSGSLSLPQWAPGSWGGHCVPIVSVNANYATCTTWGSVLTMNTLFMTYFGSEAYAIITQDQLTAKNESAWGISWPDLQADLLALGSVK